MTSLQNGGGLGRFTENFKIHDSCKRAGGAFSINYFISEDDMTVQDATTALRRFDDKNTASGNVIERYFCSNCGSPAFTKTPKFPGKVFLKATLFSKISPSESEVFSHKRLQL
ncbi:uncharacterized protein N7498_000166 [Penicillium cinerascens]|uniref:CENP-V/GFA domain-containing protein n=1 Tax=Penicillium cinerascens TaxID=70096 RepID=A0A9W9NDU6_9EURO|nr:uncharacterized protein N7498_000166 [Penicillium cinerascens]KAJ5218067.1 hypothetical protein N7498_000166 [Penicillium cinerascens]